MGECMVELAPTGDGLYRQGFAGDTLNTAWYVRGLTSAGPHKVRYVSAVGTDALSDSLLAFLSGNGIDTGSVARLGDRTVGLYLITLTGAERSFTYWRKPFGGAAAGVRPRSSEGGAGWRGHRLSLGHHACHPRAGRPCQAVVDPCRFPRRRRRGSVRPQHPASVMG